MDTNTNTIEKIYCNNPNCGSGWETAMLMNNQWGNNPFAYMMMTGMMRYMFGNDWQNRMGYDAEISARFNQLSNQMSDNHNADILADFAKGNYARIGELQTALGVDLRAIQSGICDARSAMQGVGGDIRAGFQGLQGDVKFTGERVINSNLIGLKDLQATFKDCCCENKELTQKMGYESQLAHKDTLNAMGQQTYTINDRLTGIANGMTKGFADIGYLLAQNKGDIVNNQDRNTQRIIDTLKDHWNWEQSQALQDAKGEISQLKQTQEILKAISNGGCGCGN